MRSSRPGPVPDGLSVPAAGTPGLRVLVSLAVGGMFVSVLYFARVVLIPITLAVMLSFLVAPIAAFLRRWYCGRVGSVLLAMLLPLAVLLGLGAVIGSQLSTLIREIPAEQTVIMHKVNTIRGATIGNMNGFLKRAGHELKHAAVPKAAKPTKTARPVKPAPTRVEVVPPPTSPLHVAEGIIGPVLGPLAILLLVITVASFILLYREDLRDRMIRLFGSNDLHRTTSARGGFSVSGSSARSSRSSATVSVTRSIWPG